MRKGKHLVRESYYEFMIHIQDDIKNTGYDWRSNLFNKSISKYILSDILREDLINQFQKKMLFIIDKISMIKKSVNYTVSKHYKYLN